MLRVLMMTTGQQILACTDAEYCDLATDAQTLVRHLKSRLEDLTGQPRFRLRLLCGECILQDDESLQLPMVLHLVLLQIVGPSREALDSMRVALESDDASAVEDFLSKPHDPNQEVHQSMTCLQLAARHGSLSSAKLLLEARAEIDKALQPGDATPLLLACENSQAEFVRWLLQNQADIRKAVR